LEKLVIPSEIASPARTEGSRIDPNRLASNRKLSMPEIFQPRSPSQHNSAKGRTAGLKIAAAMKD
jgi:hypothetical protein